MTDHVEALPLTNNDWWEKDTDARRWRRFIVNRRRDINPFPVAIRPVVSPASRIAVAVIPASSVLVTAVVMFSHTFMVIFGKGRRRFHTADHCG